MNQLYSACSASAEALADLILAMTKESLLAKFHSEQQTVPRELSDELEEVQRECRKQYLEALEGVFVLLAEQGDARANLLRETLEEISLRIATGVLNYESFCRGAKDNHPPYIALGVTPPVMELFSWAAKSLSSSGREQQAASLYGLLCTMDPSVLQHWVGWCEAALNAKLYRQALTPAFFLEAADELSPYPKFYLAQCYFAERDFHQGDLLCDEAMALCGDNIYYEELKGQLVSLKKNCA